jgi:hypothetical protein
MACTYYRREAPSRCIAVEGCLPARRVDRDRLCLTDHPERCDLHAIRTATDRPVDRSLAEALRDKDGGRRSERVLAATVRWLEAAEQHLLGIAPGQERLPLQTLTTSALSALQGEPVTQASRLVIDATLCAGLGRLAQTLRIAGRRVPEAALREAARVIEIGAGLDPGGHRSS